MENAYKLAAFAVKQRLAEQKPQSLEIINQIQAGEIVVLEGTFDQVEKVLTLLKVPFQINPNSTQLVKSQLIFVNCSRGDYESYLIEAIERFVTQGKWLVSSDWGLHYVIEKAFPKTIRWNQARTGEEVISVEPYMSSLWSDIVVLGVTPQWWLWGSFPIEIIDTEKVKIEAASHDLLRAYNAPVVAVRFDWGKGHVFHVISHFWAKKTSTPNLRHQGPCQDFLKEGMRLSEEGIDKVFKDAKINPQTVNFAQLQSAVTATELVAQLSVQAVSQKVLP